MMDLRNAAIDGGTKEPRATLYELASRIEGAQEVAEEQLSEIMMIVLGDDTPFPQVKAEVAEIPCLGARLESAAWRMARITDALVNLRKALA